MKSNTKIINRLKRYRLLQGELTQQDLAEKVGCSRQTIVLLEQERYVPSLALAMRIARVFGAPVDQVFTLAE